MYIEFGAIFECRFSPRATPFNKTAGFNWAFVEGCGACERGARKNRIKLNLPSWWVLFGTDSYAQDFLVPARL
ncbi:hypothetical protein [Candidatus Collinsella stercoripullorum]|uniref:hypothetical protein n=1 Tax=Candidatus Collinsella stercoripullorum TaxID=2838522 RepID=UPI0022DFFC71|nr:hypothetical protein [Candidatus Collinsella stercoripullorum]